MNAQDDPRIQAILMTLDGLTSSLIGLRDGLPTSGDKRFDAGSEAGLNFAIEVVQKAAREFRKDDEPTAEQK